jgi:hypothetical protein
MSILVATLISFAAQQASGPFVQQLLLSLIMMLLKSTPERSPGESRLVIDVATPDDTVTLFESIEEEKQCLAQKFA